jgi:CHAT domain-containing protein
MGGEGLLSIATAFLNAGAPRVVASLWKVDSAATTALMKRFHELWSPAEGEGVDAATALRRAQQDLQTLEGGRWAHPYYWAGWVLWGLAD